MSKFLRGFILIMAALSFSNVWADVDCVGTCNVWGKKLFFTFNRIDVTSYQDGLERCYRVNGSTEVVSVSQGSSTEMACFKYLSENKIINHRDINPWTAEIVLRRKCEVDFRSGDNRSYDYTQGTFNGYTCH